MFLTMNLIEKYTEVIVVAAIAFLLPIWTTLLLLGCLLFADVITGVWKARKKKIKVTSHRLADTVTKMILYSLAIICTHGLETVFPILGFVQITQIAGGFICVVELKSIYENVAAITGLDIWKHLVKQVKSLKGYDSTTSDTGSVDRDDKG